jgi:hypothetical protein
MHRRILVLAAAILVSCSQDAPRTSADGQRYLAELLRPGVDFASARQILTEKGLFIHEVPVEHCGNFHIDPKYKCAGGPAIRVTLNDNARPLNPFYSPSLVGFLAFDEAALLRWTIVGLEGGD